MTSRVLAFAASGLLLACSAGRTESTSTPAAKPTDAAPPSITTPDNASAAAAAKPKITYSQVNVDGPYIAMTFDDGPHATNTPRLLDMLQQRKIKATFFVCGQCVAQNPEVTKRIVEDGHEIANHSWSHPQLSSMNEAKVRDQLQRTHDVVRQVTGVEMKLLRPPYGAFTERQRRWSNSVWGYRVIMWNVDPLDWKNRNAATVQRHILANTIPGSIILAHDIHKTTIDAMPGTFDGLLAKGFKFVTVSELLAMDRPVVAKTRKTTEPTGEPLKPEPVPRTEKPATPPASSEPLSPTPVAPAVPAEPATSPEPAPSR